MQVNTTCPVLITGQTAFFQKALDLTCLATIADPTVELFDTEGKPLSKAEFGRLFCGLQTSLHAVLVNRSPKFVNFTVSKDGGDDAGGDADTKAESPIKVRMPSPSSAPLVTRPHAHPPHHPRIPW